MASIQIHIEDEKLLQYLRDQRGLDTGKTHQIAVKVEAQPPVQNSSVSHLVTVSVTYGLQLGEIEALAGF